MERSVNNKILLIVEGDKEEQAYARYFEVLSKISPEIVVFHQNIKNLGLLVKKYTFNGIKPNNLKDIILDGNLSDEDREKLNHSFTDTFLIFDLDIQNADDGKIKEYLNEIRELLVIFDNSTEIGQLLINYPMFESIYHLRDSRNDSYKDTHIIPTKENSLNYKNFTDSEKLTFDITKLTKNDFNLLAAINLKKANFIVKGEYEKPDKFVYQDELTQLSIFDKQCNFISEQNILYSLNSSFFIDVELYGKNLFFHGRGNRLFNDEELISSVKKK